VLVDDSEATIFRLAQQGLADWVVASDQSRPLASREIFERRVSEAQARFEGQTFPAAALVRISADPDRIEFWSDRAFRLHERRLFTRTENGWAEGLLYP
jgi:pyridoxamine 5'-phosphate oxidase